MNATYAIAMELSKDSKHLGASIGFIFILHTWGSKMNYHPHIHTIILGGGLDSKNNWKDKGSSFFFPVKVMSAISTTKAPFYLHLGLTRVKFP